MNSVDPSVPEEGQRHVKHIYEREQMKAALLLAVKWGISSDNFSADVSQKIRNWIVQGMKGPAPKAPDYYPTK